MCILQFEAASVLKGHTGTVTVASGVYIPNKDGHLTHKPRTLVASASVDSTVRIWNRPESEGRCFFRPWKGGMQ